MALFVGCAAADALRPGLSRTPEQYIFWGVLGGGGDLGRSHNARKKGFCSNRTTSLLQQFNYLSHSPGEGGVRALSPGQPCVGVLSSVLS